MTAWGRLWWGCSRADATPGKTSEINGAGSAIDEPGPPESPTGKIGRMSAVAHPTLARLSRAYCRTGRLTSADRVARSLSSSALAGGRLPPPPPAGSLNMLVSSVFNPAEARPLALEPPPPRTGPLKDITVVDLTRVLAGPYCTLLLRELGARIIKVENPGGGDDSRHFGPWLPSGDSAYFETLNGGKESIGLNLKKEEDLAVLHGLLAGADVLIENYRPGVMERMGLSFEALKDKYPRLCYASISGCARRTACSAERFTTRVQ